LAAVWRRDAHHRLRHWGAGRAPDPRALGRTDLTAAPGAARGPPLWEMPDAGKDRFDPQAQPAPDYEFDQRIA